jgi:prepilin-type N-terminal cleavage/methylation domain-containing protein
MKKLLKKNSGFTIIEVMIVLAIAGLIMVIVLIAVPQLQRQQRNEARKNVINRIATEVDNYASNNQGDVPTPDAVVKSGFLPPNGGFYTRYIFNNAAQFNDPQTGAIMTFQKWTADPTSIATVGTIYYITGKVCNGETSANGKQRNFIIMSVLEGGAVYCVDNH